MFLLFAFMLALAWGDRFITATDPKKTQCSSLNFVLSCGATDQNRRRRKD